MEEKPENTDRQRDEALRRALATPPISNEDILKRSKESRPKWLGGADPKADPYRSR